MSVFEGGRADPIRDLHIAKREEDIGYCAGYVGELKIVTTYLPYSSSFCFLTSVFTNFRTLKGLHRFLAES
ncbi:hypothetical protein ACFX13_009343 [Malus domestica]